MEYVGIELKECYNKGAVKLYQNPYDNEFNIYEVSFMANNKKLRCLLVDEIKVDIVTYNQSHSSIVKSGINAIKEVLGGKDNAEIRSLLLCLDKFLDPYYGYNLPYCDDIINLLQEQLFLTDIKEIKEDILQLLQDYSKKSLDYLAENIEKFESEPDILEEALHAIGNTYNISYVPLLIKYENHYNSSIRNMITEYLVDYSKLKSTDTGESLGGEINR